jgi:lycopene beta-cyclase
LEQADILISGAGGSGLSMAYYLSQSPWRRKRILLFDAESKEQNDRTWCFWAKEAPVFKSAQSLAWQELHFEGSDFSKTASMAPYRYYHLRGSDFYSEIKAHLSAFPNIQFVQSAVKDIEEQGESVLLRTSQRQYQAPWLFNSIPYFSPHFPLPEEAVKQYFKGYFIHSEEAVFNTKALTLMDFSLPQEASLPFFFYILPFSPHKALVECTLFSAKAQNTESFVAALEEYIHKKLKIKHFTIEKEEQGMIPMHVFSPIASSGKSRVFHIGTAGGMTKASTGYTFGRIQEACADFVARWRHFDQAPAWQASSKRHRFYDQLLLQIIRHKPWYLAGIMEALFRKNDFRDIIDFLEEKSSLLQELRLIAKLPFQPFLQACYEKYCLAKERPKSGHKPWEGVVVGDSAHS